LPEIQLDNQIISYTIQKSSRARRISLKIDAEKGLQVILPTRAKVDVDEILHEKRKWIQKHLGKFAPRRQYVSGETVPLYGVDCLLQVVPAASTSRATVIYKDDIFAVKIPANLKPSLRRETVRASLENWYRREAKRYIPPETARLAAKFGFSYQNIVIRGQKTRWGSCSSHGNLNFNWRLIMTPPEAIEYVIIHELCHLNVPDHSARFWTLVAQFCPNYRVHVDWLRNHAHLYNLI
jgi:hypothetical protein